MPARRVSIEVEAYAEFALSPKTLTDLYGTLLEIMALAQRNRDLRTYGRVKRIYDELDREATRIARDVALVATSDIRDRVRRGRLRPKTGRGRNNLANNVICGYVVTRPSIAGVKIGLIDDLDKTVNPKSRSKKSYWRAQEYGLSEGFVGREIRGSYFGPGYRPPARRPSQDRFRRDPLFRAGKGARMTIQRPIEAKFFLRDGTQEALARYGRELAALERSVAQKLNLITGDRTLGGRNVRRRRARRGR